MRPNLRCCVAFATLVFAVPTLAQFTPGPNPITTEQTAQRTLTGGTGTIDSTGAIRINSGSTVPLLMSGTSTLVNNGTIQTLGTGRAIDSNSGVANLTVTNNGLISGVSSDAFRVNTNSSVLLTNTGTIQVSNGGQAIDWAAITSASNVLDNRQFAQIRAVGEDAVRPGVNGRVTNAGVIAAQVNVTGGVATSGDGIDLRTLSGIQIDNSGIISGRHGIATDGDNTGPFSVSITNHSNSFITGNNGSGINIDGVAANVVANIFNEGHIGGFVHADATEGDGDGIDVDGLINLTNSQTVEGFDARGAGNSVEGVAAGGGTIVNNRFARIIGWDTGNPLVASNGILIDDSDGGSAVAATDIYNDGVISGQKGFGIRFVGDFNDAITNDTEGRIFGTTISIDMGAGNDTLVNRGYISSGFDTEAAGNAVELGAGDDQMVISGTNARIFGDVSGGTGNDRLTINVAGGQFDYAGVLSGFELLDVQGGNVTLHEAATDVGTTRLSGGTLVLDGRNLISAASRLELGDSALSLLNTGETPDAQSFAELALSGDATLRLGLSSITFELLESVASGSSLTVHDWSEETSPDYAFRFLGDLTGSAMFLALVEATRFASTAEGGNPAIFAFDGTYTNVSGVPIPGAVWLLASGLGILSAARRRRNASRDSHPAVIHA